MGDGGDGVGSSELKQRCCHAEEGKQQGKNDEKGGAREGGASGVCEMFALIFPLPFSQSLDLHLL